MTTCSLLLFPRVFVDDQGIRGAGGNDVLRRYPPAFLTPTVGWDGAYAPPPSYLAFVPAALATGDGIKPTCHPFQRRLPPLHWGGFFLFFFLSQRCTPPALGGFIPLFHPIYPSYLRGNIASTASGGVNPKRPCPTPLSPS